MLISILILAVLSLSWCHVGHNHEDEIAKRSEYLKHSGRSLTNCASHLRSSDHDEGSMKRHRALAQELTQERGAGVEFDAQDTFIDNSACVLQSEVTEGPYYLNGEMIRQDVGENQPGVPLILDLQIIDTTTCKPMTETWVDIWQCNSTGVYGGVVADGNGDSSDSGNVNVTALRGLQKTNSDGIVQFQTIFLGHYLGKDPQSSRTSRSRALLTLSSTDEPHPSSDP
jgi:hypothetical protein